MIVLLNFLYYTGLHWTYSLDTQRSIYSKNVPFLLLILLLWASSLAKLLKNTFTLSLRSGHPRATQYVENSSSSSSFVPFALTSHTL